MQTVWILTKRTMKLYLRQYSLVFFSLLTIFIIILLNIVFLQKMHVDNLMTMLPVSKEKATLLISSLTLSGILFTSTVTIPLAVMGTMIEDEEKKRMLTFWIAPISRLQVTLGYLFASFIMGIALSFLTLGISQVYILLIGGTLLPFMTLIKLLGVLLVTLFSSSSMVFFFTCCLRTSGSFSALNTIVGTLIGFLAAIYLPLGMLPDFVQQLLKFFPGLYGASLIRELYTKELLVDIFSMAPASALTEYQDFMGITLTLQDRTVSPLFQLLILLLSGILFILLAAGVLHKRQTTDR